MAPSRLADTVLFGQMPTKGAWVMGDQFGTQLQSSHPFSLMKPLQDTIDLTSSLVSQGKTGDTTGAVQLVMGNVECTSCHNPHVQAMDKVSMNFLVRDGSNGQICLACHDPTRTSMGGATRSIRWLDGPISAHNTAPRTKFRRSRNLEATERSAPMPAVPATQSHNAQGPVRLLRAANEQDCLVVMALDPSVSPAALNIAAEYSKIGHPFPNGTNTHDAAENPVLNNNRHATCVDCHNAHGSATSDIVQRSALDSRFADGRVGIGTDGTSVVNPASISTRIVCVATVTVPERRRTLIFGYLPSRDRLPTRST